MHSFAPFFNLKISAKNRHLCVAIEYCFFIFSVEFCIFSVNFWWIVFRISRQIPENSDVCRFFNQICENKSEICRKFWILWKLFTGVLSEACFPREPNTVLTTATFADPASTQGVPARRSAGCCIEIHFRICAGMVDRYFLSPLSIDENPFH